ncbi:ABC transporter ATP-binding protein [Enterococcus gilvus]|uniref:ATP-binding cassette domain-containing protein n=1 Tax=Enterococcus gilvus TaxID=160453 RepID=UPI003D6BABE3
MKELTVTGWQVTHLSGFEKRKVELIKQVDFKVSQGQVIGIVGESGSGKSIFMKSLMGILSDDFEIRHKTLNVVPKGNLPKMAMVFQDAKKSLNPVITIEKQLTEIYFRFQKKDKEAAKKAVVSVLKRVKITEPEKCLKQYPHELSGGMCQRIMIAMSLLTDAEILIADEPTTALDNITQKQILELLKKLNQEGLTIILISHDLQVISWLCEEIYVMYQGEFVEQGSTERILSAPENSYTKKLLESIPKMALEKIRELVHSDAIRSE